MVVVGGVPGAGKSTALARLADDPAVRVLDPDHLRRAVARWLPRLAYRCYRPLVHVAHQALVWTAILAGAGVVGLVLPGVGVLLVHDTATRRRRRESMVRQAAGRGWRPRLVLIDVTRDEALTGQRERRRTVDPAEFDRHWRRWRRLRQHTVVGCPVEVVTREHAVSRLRALVADDVAAVVTAA